MIAVEKLTIVSGGQTGADRAARLDDNRIGTINVAGQRASGAPGIETFVHEVLDAIIPANVGGATAELDGSDTGRQH